VKNTELLADGRVCHHSAPLLNTILRGWILSSGIFTVSDVACAIMAQIDIDDPESEPDALDTLPKPGNNYGTH
jgi:hypothetical protein